MKGKAKFRFLLLAAIIMVMMVALVMKLSDLTIKEGTVHATEADTLRSSTVYTTGARGRILDRNGIPLAYDSISYNVQFYRDPERTSEADSALYTQSLLSAIAIIEKGGGATIDTSYIRMDANGEPVYDWGVTEPDAVKARYRNFCNAMGFTIKDADKDDPSKWITASDAYNRLRASWKIPVELPFSEAVKVMSIRQEVNMNKWRAYEPVTIAYNVSMDVVAQLDMRKDELIGVETQQSTTRVYPWGTTAAHIIGYLSRQVTNAMTGDGMQRMGYAQGEYADAYAKDANGNIQSDANGNQLVDMTKLGYSYNDYIGIAGVEKTMEKYLTADTNAQRGTQTIEKNKQGTVIRALDKAPASNGDDVMLTIDLPLQKVTEDALANAIQQIHTYEENLLTTNAANYQKLRADLSTIKLAETGSIVVLDVNTGKLLAMASYPTFDPNKFMSPLSDADKEALFGKDSNMPTLNRAVASRLAPGSIFKMATGLAGLMEGKITPTTQISDQSPYTQYVSGDVITQNAPSCWISPYNLAQHANLTVSSALTFSCNFFFFTVADRLGIDTLNAWATKLGLSSATGIELPGELVSHVGGQDVLYDYTKPVEDQESSLPQFVKKAIADYLKQTVLTYRGVPVDDATVNTCAEHLLELQKGAGTSQEFGTDIRRILSTDLGLPIGITKTQNWSATINSMLTELQWKPTMTIRAGIGQAATLVTPIAVARYAAAFGNGGTVYDVHIVDRITDQSGAVVKLFEPTVYNKIEAPQEYWDAIHKGMAGVVSPEDHGTAQTAFSAEFQNEGYLAQIMGKSGTAQISASKNVDIEDTAWFVTLLPKDKPEIAVITCFPYGYSGSRAGGPAVEEITRFYLDRKNGSAKENLVGANGLIP